MENHDNRWEDSNSHSVGVIDVMEPPTKTGVRDLSRTVATTSPYEDTGKHVSPPVHVTARDRATARKMPIAMEQTAPRISDLRGATPTPAPPVLPKRSWQPRVGMAVHKYQLIRELGRGGMGAVFLARDTRLGRLVAIKFLSIKSQEMSQRFIAEARATARCNHENIVVIFEADEFSGMPYMALEYVEGKTLRQLMKEHQAPSTLSPADGDNEAPAGRRLLSAERALSIALPMLRALHRAHEMGIVHRDLKPENIMLSNSGTVKVLDFGIAKVLAGDEVPVITDISGVRLEELASIPSMTSTGALVGTLPYMSPEQFHAEIIDHRADIWAVGIILFEMITGRHPMAPLSRGKILEVADSDTPMPKLSALRPDLGALGSLVDRCLCKNLDERIGSIEALLRELEPLRPGHRKLVLGVDESPFAGLAAFQESDADRFFGRANDIASVTSRVRSHPLVAVVAPSGVGKSSLVRAGVIPALKHAGEGWESFVLRPGRKPITALTDLLFQLLLRSSTDQASHTHHQTNPYETTPTEGSDLTASSIDGASAAVRQTIANRLTDEPGYLGAELRTWAQRKTRRVVVFVDQFEEIYTQGVSDAERDAFLACLAGVADDASSPLRVVFSMRSDFIQRLAENRAFMVAATRGLVFLGAIGRAGLRDALVRPVEAARYRFESPQMVEDMLDELEHTSGALPLLQFTAANLWESRDRSRRLLTQENYRAMGGVAGTLARHADAVLASMGPLRAKIARAIFERLVTPERTRAIASVGELRELSGDSDRIEEVLQDLASARLLSIETGTDASGLVEIVHESLITGWPKLTRWLDENQEDAAFLSRLRTAAHEWDKSGGQEGMLWRGDIETEARRFDERYHGTLPGRERRYLDAVFTAADRTQRRQRLLVGGTIATLGLMVVAAIIALVSIRQAQQEAHRQAAIVKQQLETLEQKDRERQAAEREAAAAEQEAAEAKGVADLSKEELRTALEKQKQIARAADRAAEEARRARDLAEKATLEAKQLARAEKSLREKLQRERDERERRRKRREKKTGDIRETLR